MGKASYDPEFIGKVEAEDKETLQKKIVQTLSEVLGQEVEGVMAEYIVVMVGNQKNMQEIHDEMVDFLGSETAATAVQCIYELLTESIPDASPSDSMDENPVTTSSDAIPSQNASQGSQKKIINLSGVKSTTTDSSLNKSTIRVIGSSTKKDLKNALKSRSERFGIPEKKDDNKRPTKPSITERLGAKVDHKNDQRHEKDQRDSQKSRGNGRDQRENKKRKDSNREENEIHNDDNDQPNPKRSAHGKDQRDRRQGGSERGPLQGPYPPYPYQGFPPPYHMPPPEYMYGYPPHHMPGFGFPPMGGPYHPRPQGPRRFNNKWVNPGSTTEESSSKVDGASEEPANDGSSGQPIGQLAPRGFGYGYPRPRFQNKTWVRPDSKETDPIAAETLSASLPKTP